MPTGQEHDTGMIQSTIEGWYRYNLVIAQGLDSEIITEDWGMIQQWCSNDAGMMQGWCRDDAGMIQGWFRDDSGMIQGWFRKNLRMIQGWLKKNNDTDPFNQFEESFMTKLLSDNMKWDLKQLANTAKFQWKNSLKNKFRSQKGGLKYISIVLLHIKTVVRIMVQVLKSVRIAARILVDEIYEPNFIENTYKETKIILQLIFSI